MHVLSAIYQYSNVVTAGATVLAALAAIIGAVEAIHQYKRETKRKKRSETLVAYSDLFKETYDLRDEYFKNLPNADLFAFRHLRFHPILLNKVYNLLTHFEDFAKGLKDGIYDFRIYIYQTPQEMFEIQNILTQFVYEARRSKGYNLLFNDFIALVNYTSLCMQNKLSNKKIPRKYKQLKV